MVVRGGAMGWGSGDLGGWLCTRRGEKKKLEIGPDFGPPGGRAGPQIEHSLPPGPPNAFFSLYLPSLNPTHSPALQGRGVRHPGPLRNFKLPTVNSKPTP